VNSPLRGETSEEGNEAEAKIKIFKVALHEPQSRALQPLSITAAPSARPAKVCMVGNNLLKLLAFWHFFQN